jgi:TldD protein
MNGDAAMKIENRKWKTEDSVLAEVVRWICTATFALVLAALSAPSAVAQTKAQPGDADQTLRAMRDEMERSKARLRIENQEKPFYIEYRLLDVDVRAVTASFGALVSNTTSRNRFMSVDVRVGDYMLDSSNFVSDDSFRGFIGSTGQVGIDRDYDSLRQDLWLATDQAYKEALVRLSRKRGYIQSLARRPDIPDFSRAEPLVKVDARLEPDWTSRNWEEEAKSVSAEFRKYPALYSSRVLYYLIYTTTYLMNSEGTQMRTSRSLAAIEASAEAQAPDDGMGLHNFYSRYAARPADLPQPTAVGADLVRMSRDLMALRISPPATDYSGPVLFEGQASAALLAQMLGPSISGARPPLSLLPVIDQMMERLGARSEWSGRLNTRVLPAGVILRDDPTATEFKGQPLLGSYDVDEEGGKAERVNLVEDGMLKNLLMSRRPGPDLGKSNGHGRSAGLSEPRPMMSNLFVESSQGKSPADLRKEFLDACKAEGLAWCVVVKQMDNPALGSQRQDDFTEALMSGGGSERVPLLVYRVFVADGHEELMRGSKLAGLNMRALRNIAGIGNDATLYAFFQNPQQGIAGTALGAFGSVQGGMPTTVIAPSLLLNDVDVRGARGEPRRPPLVPPPPIQ